MHEEKLGIAVVFVVALVSILSILLNNPIVSCGIEVPESYVEAAKEEAKGLYSFGICF